MTMSVKNRELVKSLHWLSQGNPNVADAQRAMKDAAKAITDLEKQSDQLLENLAEYRGKYIEQERDYIIPLYIWAATFGFDLEQVVTNNPGKNCVELLTEIIGHALQESVKLQSHYAGLLNQYDQGERMRFENPAAWVNRLRELKGK